MVRLRGINVVYTENARVSMPGILGFFLSFAKTRTRNSTVDLLLMPTC